MIPHGRVRLAALLVASLGIAALSGPVAAQDKPKGKPSIAVRATPGVVFVRTRVVATAELRNGADDFEDFYCAKVEWTWGDGTTSEQQDDCDPYVAGTSEIRRRYTTEHRYDVPGTYQIRFALLQNKKTVGSAAMTVSVRDGEPPVR